MKHLLIFLIFISFIGCGNNSSKNSNNKTDINQTEEDVNSSKNDINQTEEDTNSSKNDINQTEEDINSSKNDIINDNLDVNKTNAVNNNIESNSTKVIENNSTEDLNISMSEDEIKEYLRDEYETSIIQNETKESIEEYIKKDPNYSISPLNKKFNKRDNIRVFYDKNIFIDIPKQDIYVVKNREGSQIFLTIDGNDSLDSIEEYPILLFYHDKLSYNPTGFTNIDVNSTTKASLIGEIEKAFSQVGLNDFEISNNNKSIIYRTDIKNTDSVIECRIGDIPNGITIRLDDNGSIDLSNYPIDISSEDNITCSLEDSNNSLYLTSILKEMQGDFNITTDNSILTNRTREESYTPQTTTATPQATPTPATDIENNNNPLSRGNNNQVSKLYGTKITILKRPDNSISHEVYITVSVENTLIDKKKLRITGKIEDVYSSRTYTSVNSYSADSDSIVLAFKNINVIKNDQKTFKLKYIIENIETKEKIEIDSNKKVKVYGNFSGYTENDLSSNSNKFSLKNITTFKEETFVSNSTYYDTITIAINRPSNYELTLEIYKDSGGETGHHSETKKLGVRNENEKKIDFVVKYIDIGYFFGKLKIVDSLTGDEVVKTGRYFNIR